MAGDGKRGVGGKGPGGTCSKVLGGIDGDAPGASSDVQNTLKKCFENTK